jgi:D,D-heptose 1,7-bisphosphate phosphatase
MRKICFLDRDGTLNKDIGYLHEPDKVELIGGIKGALKALKTMGYEFIIITNQSGIARGMFGWAELTATNREIFRQCDIEPLDVFVCPHLPDGGVEKYAVQCTCRKPHSGLFEQALERYPDIDMAQSIMIGDSVRDCDAAFNMDLRSFLLWDKEDPKPDVPEKCQVFKKPWDVVMQLVFEDDRDDCEVVHSADDCTCGRAF